MMRTNGARASALFVFVVFAVATVIASASAASAPRRLSSPSSSSSSSSSSSMHSSNSMKTLKCEDEGKPVTHLFGRAALPQKSCSSVGVVLANERARFSFEVAKGRTVACELNALSGDADLEVSPPAHEGGPGPKSSREAFGIDRVAFSASEASLAGPGTYVAEVFGFADETSFELRCAVGSAPASTAKSPDLKSLKSVLDQCCAHGSSSSSCPALRASLEDAEAGGPGPCGVPPNECDENGHLTTLSLAGDGLRCAFPDALADLSGTLRELDLGLNDLDGEVGSHVAPVLSKLPKLEAVSLSLNRIRGQLSCEMIGASSSSSDDDEESSSSKKRHSSSSSPLPSRLSRLTATHNRLSGPIPSCLLDPSKSPIQELSLAANELSGRLPRIGDERDVAEEDEGKRKSSSSTSFSPLRVLSLGDQAGGGFEGQIPCLACAPGLEVVQLQGNSLGGHLPKILPPRLKELRLSGNSIGGGIPAWSPDSLALLEVLSLDGNAFEDKAEIPASVSGAPSLRLLSAAGSGLGGDLPSESWGPSLERVLLGNNSFTGELPAALARVPGLELLDLSSNQLSGELGAFADALEGAQGARRGALRYLNLASNDLEGKVPQGLAAAGALSPGAWGAIPVFSGGSHGGGGSGRRSGSSSTSAASAAGVVVLRKTLNLTDNRLTGPLPDFLVRAMAEDKDVEIGLGGERNEFDCPERGNKIAVSRAMPRSVAEGVSCRVRGGGGERRNVEEVIEVREDADDRRSSSSSSSKDEDEDDDKRSSSSSSSSSKSKKSGFAPKAAEAKSGLSRPGGGDDDEGDNPRRRASPSSSSHDSNNGSYNHSHHRSLAATLGLALAHLVGWCSLAALGLAAWRHREALLEKAAALRAALPPPLSGLLGGGSGSGSSSSFSANGYSGLGGGSNGLHDDTLEMIDVDFAADAFQPDARAFSGKDSLLAASGGAVVEVKVRAGGGGGDEESGGGSSSSSSSQPAAAAAPAPPPPPSENGAPSETIGAYRPPQPPPAGYQD